MSRLRHGASALLRYFQMSRKQLFVIVEGHQFDKYAYSRIVEPLANASGVSFQIISAKELPGATGGKKSVLSFFRFMRRHSGFLLTLQQRRRTVVFCLDKDIDDLLKKTVYSPHVAYTTHYDLESHIVHEGNLTDAIAAATSLGLLEVQERVGNIVQMRNRLAAQWQAWVSICLYVAFKNLPAPSYGSLSRVNNPINGPVDLTDLADSLANLQRLTGLTQQDFTRDFDQIERLVQQHLHNNTYHSIFKGKWYLSLFDAELRSLLSGCACNLQQLPGQIGAVLQTSVDYTRPWADGIRASMTHAISLL
jgi:hypothetical protein